MFAKYQVLSLDTDKMHSNFFDQLGLTRRELDLACGLSEGGSDKNISNALHISIPTLRSHIQHVFDKLLVNSRTEFCSKVFLGSGSG